MLLVILEELNLSTCIVWGGWFDIFLNNLLGDDSPILTHIVLNGLKTQQLELVASLVTRYKEIYVNWNVVSVGPHEQFMSTGGSSPSFITHLGHLEGSHNPTEGTYDHHGC